jgi:enoyl-CoA hydratase
MVGEVVEATDLEVRFLAYCEQLAAVAPIAARQTKRLVTRAGLPPDLEALLRDEMTYVRRGLSSEDGREAVRAILEKRKPQFRGR